jgi:D-alanyl-D-alanine-carboxypeptidase/D-alanyl-D-alanine-endopeptidase
MRIRVPVLLLALPLPAQEPAPPAIDAVAIGRLVDEARAKDGLPGVVVGVLHGKERAVVARGTGGADAAPALDGDTVFEIGSITKAFTGILLAELCARGEVTLETRVQELLPEGVTVPRRGREITLLDLATHRSSLPRIPSNLESASLLDPYAGYGPDRLHEFLAEYSLRRDVGERYDYSNLGAGLLGHALALQAKTGYEALLRERVLAPLGMRDTFLTVPAAARARLAVGHLPNGQPARSWSFDCLAGCGALRSTANDMLRFAACNLGTVETPLREVLRAAQQPRRDAEGPVRIGLGWHVTPWGEDDPVVWHNGRVRPPRPPPPVLVLANRAASVDALGIRILRLVGGGAR